MKPKSDPLRGPSTVKPDKIPDPDLTLTPLRADCHKSKDLEDYDANMYKKPKVRFDLNETDKDDRLDVTTDGMSVSSTFKASDKLYRPELYDDISGNDKLDGEMLDTGVKSGKEVFDSEAKQGNSRTVKYTVETVNNKTVYVPIKDTQMYSEAQKQSTRSDEKVNSLSSKSRVSKGVRVIREKSSMGSQQSSGKTQNSGKSQDHDPIAACKIPEQVGKPRKAKVVREVRSGDVDEPVFPFSQVRSHVL